MQKEKAILIYECLNFGLLILWCIMHPIVNTWAHNLVDQFWEGEKAYQGYYHYPNPDYAREIQCLQFILYSHFILCLVMSTCSISRVTFACQILTVRYQWSKNSKKVSMGYNFLYFSPIIDFCYLTGCEILHSACQLGAIWIQEWKNFWETWEALYTQDCWSEYAWWFKKWPEWGKN